MQGFRVLFSGFLGSGPLGSFRVKGFEGQESKVCPNPQTLGLAFGWWPAVRKRGRRPGAKRSKLGFQFRDFTPVFIL